MEPLKSLLAAVTGGIVNNPALAFGLIGGLVAVALVVSFVASDGNPTRTRRQ